MQASLVIQALGLNGSILLTLIHSRITFHCLLLQDVILTLFLRLSFAKHIIDFDSNQTTLDS